MRKQAAYVMPYRMRGTDLGISPRDPDNNSSTLRTFSFEDFFGTPLATVTSEEKCVIIHTHFKR